MRWISVLVLSLMILAACGGGNDDDQAESTDAPTATEAAEGAEASDPTATSAPTEEPSPTPTEEPTETPTEPPTATPTTEPTATPTSAPTATPTTEPTEAPEPAEQDLSGLLLALEDMPTGWTVWDTGADEDAGEDTGSDTGICGEPPPETVIEPLAEDEVGYTRGQIGPFFNQLVAVYADAGQAEEIMSYIESTFTCTEWTETTGTGEETTYQLSPLSFPATGDQSYGFRMSTEAGMAGTLEFDVVFVRTGEIVTAVFHGALDGVDSEFTQEYTMRAVEKIENNR